MDKETAIQKLKEFCEKYDLHRDKTIELYAEYKSGASKVEIDTYTGYDIYTFEQFWSYINTTDIRNVFKKTPVEYIEDETQITNPTELSKIRKDAVTYKAKLNAERNLFNKQLRELSSLEELNKEVIDRLYKLPKVNIKREDLCYSDGSVGVIAIGDIHANELIDTPRNKYDFNVLSKRLKKLAIQSKKYFKNNNINSVVVMFLGDLLNSDRRMSEVFNMATNRSCAVVLLFHILRQFLIDISQSCNVVVASATGNESRVVGEEYDTSDILATYNYDYTLHEFLKVAFEKDDRINFIDGNFAEKVVNIAGSNVLMTHGTSFTKDIEKSVQQTFGRYSANGIVLDYLFCGHLHSARIGDMYARTGSLCGGNSYSEGALNLASRASELIGIFYPDKTNTVTRVDLQNTDNIQGYEIIEDLEKYNVKSALKKEKFLVHNAF